MRYALRISLPDRPGALSGVTGAIARLRGDIERVEVVERSDGVAVDDVSLTVDVDAATLREAVESAPGAVVESLEQRGDATAVLDPMDLAALCVAQGRGAVATLVQRLPEALGATWSAALAQGVGGVEPLARSAAAPLLDGLTTPWLPLEAPRRLPAAVWMPEAWSADGRIEVAAAPLGQPTTALLVARARGPRFRSVELAHLARLAEIAVGTEVRAAREVRVRAG